MPGKINPEWLKQFFSVIKEGHSLVIHLEILQTTYFVIIRPYSAAGCLRLWQFLVMFFVAAHLVNEIGGLCNGSEARCLYHIKLSLRLQAR